MRIRKHGLVWHSVFHTTRFEIDVRSECFDAVYGSGSRQLTNVERGFDDKGLQYTHGYQATYTGTFDQLLAI